MAYLIIESGLNGHQKLDISLLGDAYYDRIKRMVSKKLSKCKVSRLLLYFLWQVFATEL